MSYAVGIVVHPTRPVDGSVRSIVDWARAQGLPCLGRTADAERLGPGVTCVPDAEFLDRTDGVVALGGDGTMLGAMRLVAGRTVPCSGSTTGTWGSSSRSHPRTCPLR